MSQAKTGTAGERRRAASESNDGSARQAEAAVRPQGARHRHCRQQLSADRRRRGAGGDGARRRPRPKDVSRWAISAITRSPVANRNGWAWGRCSPVHKLLRATWNDAPATSNCLKSTKPSRLKCSRARSAFASPRFAAEHLGRDSAIGELPPREAQRQRRSDRAGPSRRHHRRPAGPHAARGRSGKRTPARPGLAVHRRRPGLRRLGGDGIGELNRVAHEVSGPVRSDSDARLCEADKGRSS